MKGWVYGLLCVLGLIVHNIAAQSDSKLRQQLMSDVFYLASDSLEGRQPGTPGAEISAQWISNRFETLGLQPLTGDTYTQPFSYSENGNSVNAKNLLAKTSAVKPCKLLIMAHYDHLGRGNDRSREVFKNKIHNGADDNASGVALLLALAESYAKQKDILEYSVAFACLSGHETGLFGADFLVQTLGDSLKSTVRYVVNFDMVGRLDNSQSRPTLFFRLPQESVWSTSLMPVSSDSLKITVKQTDSPLDHTPFSKKGIPAATFSTGIHDDYHRASDDADKINYAGLEQVFYFTQRFIKELF